MPCYYRINTYGERPWHRSNLAKDIELFPSDLTCVIYYHFLFGRVVRQNTL